jgi:hypothetical protein
MGIARLRIRFLDILWKIKQGQGQGANPYIVVNAPRRHLRNSFENLPQSGRENGTLPVAWARSAHCRHG